MEGIVDPFPRSPLDPWRSRGSVRLISIPSRRCEIYLRLGHSRWNRSTPWFNPRYHPNGNKERTVLGTKPNPPARRSIAISAIIKSSRARESQRRRSMRDSSGTSRVSIHRRCSTGPRVPRLRVRTSTCSLDPAIIASAK